MKLAIIEHLLLEIEANEKVTKLLEAENGQLTQTISELTASVAGGNRNAVNDLAIAKARKEILPTEMAELRRGRSGYIDELSGEVSSLYPMLGRLYSEEYHRVENEVKKFLSGLLSNGHTIQEMARQVANECNSVRKLDVLRGQFSGLMIGGRPNPDNVLSRARFAVQQLENI